MSSIGRLVVVMMSVVQVVHGIRVTAIRDRFVSVAMMLAS